MTDIITQLSTITSTTFQSYQDAVDALDVDNLAYADTLSIRKDKQISFYESQVVVYTTGGCSFSGVVEAIYADAKNGIIYLIVNRLGVPRLHDTLTVKDESLGGLDIIFNAYTESVIRSHASDMMLADIIECLTQKTLNTDIDLLEEINDAVEERDGILAAVNELLEVDNQITMH